MEAVRVESEADVKMNVSDEVWQLVRLGPLPAIDSAEVAIAAHESALRKIPKPVTDEEAALLLRLFGPDDCYGLAWSLLHLIESAPSGVALPERVSGENEWVRRLRERAGR